jgi:uncharacterized damage-inducible protein DinB
MNAQKVLKETMSLSRFLMGLYLSDFTEADLLTRPSDAGNTLAWQIGHLIVSEHNMLNGIKPGASPALPSGFAEAHSKETARGDGPFASKAVYLAAMEAQRAATLAAIDTLSEADLDQPAPEAMRSYAPTVGAVFIMIGGHETLHAGQVAVARRSLGKPVLI